MKQISLHVYQSIDGCPAPSDKHFDAAVDASSCVLIDEETYKGRERYKEDGASEDIKIQQHQLNRHIGKAGQYIRTNSVLCHITLWLTKQPLHEWQRS